MNIECAKSSECVEEPTLQLYKNTMHFAGFKYPGTLAPPPEVQENQTIKNTVIQYKIVVYNCIDIKNKGTDLYRPPKVRPKNLTIGGRYFYG